MMLPLTRQTQKRRSAYRSKCCIPHTTGIPPQSLITHKRPYAISSGLCSLPRCSPCAEADAAAELAPAVVVRCDGPFRHEHHWRGAGLAAPVFALRTRSSVGSGEFADIKQLVNICNVAGTPVTTPIPTKFPSQTPSPLPTLGESSHRWLRILRHV